MPTRATTSEPSTRIRAGDVNPLHRAPRVWTAAAMILIGAAAATLIIADQRRDDTSPHPKTSAESREEAADPCEQLSRRIEACRFVTIDDTTRRYALIRRKDAVSTTIVDIGGPGIAALASSYPKRIIQAVPADQNVLVLDEPWTTADVPGECATNLSDWYTALRDRSSFTRPTAVQLSATDLALAGIAEACDLASSKAKWGFTAQSYRTLIERIEDEESIEVDSFWGLSFGSVRLRYAGDRVESALLGSPFPDGIDAETFLRARSQVQARVDVPDLRGAAVRGRSLPLTSLDLDAAASQALYLAPQDRAALFAGARSDVAKIIGRLSDQLYGRFGTSSISPAILAFWQESCAAVIGWHNVPTARFTANSFTELFRMCPLLERQADEDVADVERIRNLGGVVRCVGIVRGDAITPSQAVNDYLSRAGLTSDVVVDGPHAADKTLESCRRVVGLSAVNES